MHADADTDTAAQLRAAPPVEGGSGVDDELLLAFGHELRNPVHGLCAALEVLQAGGAQGDAAEVALRQGRRLARLVDEWLDLARLLAGRTPLCARPQDLAEIVGRAARACELQGAACRLEAQPAPAALDERHLEPLLVRLLGALGRLGPVSAIVRPQGRRAVVDLRCEGEAGAATQLPEGDLLLARRLVELHGGCVVLQSAGVVLEFPETPG